MGAQRVLTVSGVAVSVVKNGTPITLAGELSLDLSVGEVLFISGESGCGKSTFLRTLVRLNPLEAGTITFCGRDLHDWDPAVLRSQMLYVSQHPSFPDLSVRDVLLLPFAFKAVSKATPSEETVNAMLSRLGLKRELANQPARLLSGGEAERVALARALLIDPPVLLLDEPTANLDAVNSARVARAITDWTANGEHSVIWVTHEQAVTDGIPGKRLILKADGFTTERESGSLGMAL